jgi:hypothetical protein
MKLNLKEVIEGLIEECLVKAEVARGLEKELFELEMKGRRLDADVNAINYESGQIYLVSTLSSQLDGLNNRITSAEFNIKDKIDRLKQSEEYLKKLQSESV